MLEWIPPCPSLRPRLVAPGVSEHASVCDVIAEEVAVFVHHLGDGGVVVADALEQLVW